MLFRVLRPCVYVCMSVASNALKLFEPNSHQSCIVGQYKREIILDTIKNRPLFWPKFGFRNFDNIRIKITPWLRVLYDSVYNLCLEACFFDIYV